MVLSLAKPHEFLQNGTLFIALTEYGARVIYYGEFLDREENAFFDMENQLVFEESEFYERVVSIIYLPDDESERYKEYRKSF